MAVRRPEPLQAAKVAKVGNLNEAEPLRQVRVRVRAEAPGILQTPQKVVAPATIVTVPKLGIVWHP